MPTFERTDLSFEIKSLTNREFDGYGSTFGNEDLGGDIVQPGAFKNTLASAEKKGKLPRMFWNHNPDIIPGKWLTMQEDAKGLYVKGILANTTIGNDLHALFKMGAVTELSIGYNTVQSERDKAGRRLLQEINLWEVSPVSLAMNEMAEIQHVKNLVLNHELTPRVLEHYLRDVGLSKRLACKLASIAFDDDDLAGGMLEGHRWDTGSVDGEEGELLRTLERSTASMIEGAFRR